MSQVSTPHRPRKKNKQLLRSNTLTDIIKVQGDSDSLAPEFNLAAFFIPARGVSQWITIPLILIWTGLLRWALGFWGYSGMNKPPMFGDFEAQRHWMEITQHLPVSMWYFYDLQYWGLDYPPLTAYHSWICGKIGSLIRPEWFALYSSRGFEDQSLTLFMRATVIISEYLVYVAALIIFVRHYSRQQGAGSTHSNIALVAILLQPSTMIIDHGHFQYNTVMLGLFVASLSSIFAGRHLWSCIYFVLALGFKQMALYYSPVIFAYLLGSCLTPRIRPGRLVAIVLATIISFAILFGPLILGTLYELRRGFDLPYRPPPLFLVQRRISLDASTPTGAIALQLSQIIHRIFPFSRGLFEDKVANIWCTVHHTAYKLQKLEPFIALPRLAGYFTFMTFLPSLVTILAVPRPSLLPYAFASSAYAFFLFSFQVHEKSILLPLLPLTLLLASRKGLSKEYRAWIGFANTIAMFSMYPLLARDGLRTPYVVLLILWNWLLGLPPFSANCYYDPDLPNVPGRPLADDELRTPTKIFHWWMYIAMLFWHLFNAFVHPDELVEGKPDLWVVVNCAIGCVGIVVCYLWSTWKLLCGTGLLDDYFEHSARYLAGIIGDDETIVADGEADAIGEGTVVVATPEPEREKKSPSKGSSGKKGKGKKR